MEPAVTEDKLSKLMGGQKGRSQTGAGFISGNLRKIPTVGEHFVWERNRVEIVDMDGNRINEVLVVPRKEPGRPSVVRTR